MRYRVTPQHNQLLGKSERKEQNLAAVILLARFLAISLSPGTGMLRHSIVDNAEFAWRHEHEN
jgi:hypothetical protein